MSPAQQKIAQTIWKFEQRREPALVSEIVRSLHYAAESSLTATLKIMERDGMLAIHGGGEKGRPRALVLTARGRHALGVGGVPLLGTIPAGPLAEAIEDAEIAEAVLPSRAGDFLLKVKGDSMTGDGILDGDLVLLRPQVTCEEGEIAAVLVGDAHEATLKRIFFARERVILRASNPAYPDRELKAEDVRVAGVFRGLIRHGSRK